MLLKKVEKEKAHQELFGKVLQLIDISIDEYGITVLRFFNFGDGPRDTLEIRQGKYSSNVDVYIEQTEEVAK